MPAIFSLIEFPASSDGLHWQFLPRGLIAVSLLAAFVGLLVTTRGALLARRRAI